MSMLFWIMGKILCFFEKRLAFSVVSAILNVRAYIFFYAAPLCSLAANLCPGVSALERKAVEYLRYRGGRGGLDRNGFARAFRRGKRAALHPPAGHGGCGGHPLHAQRLCPRAGAWLHADGGHPVHRRFRLLLRPGPSPSSSGNCAATIWIRCCTAPARI
jgi:hypothetical protein